jgi:hypothetical protein
MKKPLVVIITLLFGFVGIILFNLSGIARDTDFGINLPFGWVTKSNEFLEDAQCIQSVAPYRSGVPFYTTIYDGVGSCGNPIQSNILGGWLNILFGVIVFGVIEFAIYKVLKRIAKP